MMKPAMRVEEDLAFFEKKYKMKITGVKPTDGSKKQRAAR
jgi:hypothetical protein